MQTALNLPDKDNLRPDEFADICGVTKRTVYRWIAEERLDGVFRVNNKRFLIPTTCVYQVVRLSSECYLEEKD